MEWKAQYKSPHWQKRRLEMLEAAKWCCSGFGSKDKQLHVHHKQYLKGHMIWEYSDEQLTVLCEDCRDIHHRLNDEVKRLLSEVEDADLERVYGYLIGLQILQADDADALFYVTSYECGMGIADVFKLEPEVVLIKAHTNNYCVSRSMLREDGEA